MTINGIYFLAFSLLEERITSGYKLEKSYIMGMLIGIGVLLLLRQHCIVWKLFLGLSKPLTLASLDFTSKDRDSCVV